MTSKFLIILVTILGPLDVAPSQVVGKQGDTLRLRYGKPVPVPEIIDTVKRVCRPPLNLQEALRIACAYLEKERISALQTDSIDISDYFLTRVSLGEYGSEGNIKQVWYFFWSHENCNSVRGFTIIVSMSGEPYWLSDM